ATARRRATRAPPARSEAVSAPPWLWHWWAASGSSGLGPCVENVQVRGARARIARHRRVEGERARSPSTHHTGEPRRLPLGGRLPGGRLLRGRRLLRRGLLGSRSLLGRRLLGGGRLRRRLGGRLLRGRCRLGGGP